MTKKSNPSNIHYPNFGFTDTETVKLDFDDSPFKTVRYWASRIMKWFKLKGYTVLKSSKNHYHVVFDREVSWSENVRIMAWACLEIKTAPLTKWFLMQGIKEGSTLRVGSKKGKPSPRVVFRCGCQNGQINGFLRFRILIKNVVRKSKVSD